MSCCSTANVNPFQHRLYNFARVHIRNCSLEILCIIELDELFDREFTLLVLLDKMREQLHVDQPNRNPSKKVVFTKRKKQKKT